MANNRNYELNGGDFISSLPNDVLLIILSKLDIKEQARTSILSSRWTNLWALNTCCLDIDAEDLMRRSETGSRIMILIKFISAVDQILSVHRGQTIDQLKLAYPPNSYEIPGDQLDGWIDIARQKQVKVLYLDLGRCVRIFSFGSASFSSLVTLTLKNVSLSGEIIHNLLSNSPNLLELSIMESVGDLSISGSSLKLKHLELKGNSISFLEISAPNLVSFSFSTRMDVPNWPGTCFKDIPPLVRLSCPLGLILRARREFYSLLPQLVTLALTVSKDSKFRDTGNFPVLLNITQMHVRLLSGCDEGGLLHWLSRLFKASPHLCRLSFDLGSRVLKHSLIENFPSHEFIEELEILNINECECECEVQPLISILMSCPSL